MLADLKKKSASWSWNETGCEQALEDYVTHQSWQVERQRLASEVASPKSQEQLGIFLQVAPRKLTLCADHKAASRLLRAQPNNTRSLHRRPRCSIKQYAWKCSD